MSSSLVFGQDEKVLSYLESRLDTKLNPPFTTIGIEKRGEIVGGWLFNDYNGHNVEISVALDTQLTRGMIRAVKDYLFNQMKVRVVTGRCRDGNLSSRELMTRLGFIYRGHIPFYFGTEGARLYTYTKGAK